MAGSALTASLIIASPAAAAVGWGINLDNGAYGNPPAFAYQSNPYFTALLGGGSCGDSAPAGMVCYARIYVPWDAVNDGKGSFAAGTCHASASGPGTPAAQFAAQVSAAARAVGTSHVLVSLTTAPAGSKDDIWPTDDEFECGLSGLQKHAPGVTDWQVFNEPDSAYIPDSSAAGRANCTSRNGVWVGGANVAYQCVFATPAVKQAGGNGHGGSAQGAAYWYLDAKRVDADPSHTLVAGGYNYGSSRCTIATCYYNNGYLRVLSLIYPHPPDAIALNPYIDVMYAALNGGNPVPPASAGLATAQGAIAAINRFYPSEPPVWFTEAGVWMNYGGSEPVTSGCADGNPEDDGTWTACLNGNPTAQALAAEGYLRLAAESPQVERIFYYDFNDQNSGWDSGLVNQSQSLAGPDGYGTPRTAWCVIHNSIRGESPEAAASDAIRPGGACDTAQHGAAPIVDATYFSDPLTPAAPADVTPAEIGRDVMLSVAERVRVLSGTLGGEA